MLSWPGEARFAGPWPTLAVLGACLAWAIDNNLTRRISLTDATWIAAGKDSVAGAVNLALFVVGLRHLGTVRTGAYFSIAPFFGALVALLMGDALTPQLLAAGALMAFGTWLHLMERHEHEHPAMHHDHEHSHDEHHRHEHETPVAPGTRHPHPHRHEPLAHSHAHYPDELHRHGH